MPFRSEYFPNHPPTTHFDFLFLSTSTSISILTQNISFVLHTYLFRSLFKDRLNESGHAEEERGEGTFGVWLGEKVSRRRRSEIESSSLSFTHFYYYCDDGFVCTNISPCCEKANLPHSVPSTAPSLHPSTSVHVLSLSFAVRENNTETQFVGGWLW